MGTARGSQAFEENLDHGASRPPLDNQVVEQESRSPELTGPVGI